MTPPETFCTVPVYTRSFSGFLVGTCVCIMCKFKYKIARDCNVIVYRALVLFKDIFNTNRVNKWKTNVQSTRYMIFICVYVTTSGLHMCCGYFSVDYSQHMPLDWFI